MTTTDSTSFAGRTAGTTPVGVGLIGAGAIGAFHAESLARRVPGARLAAVADPAPGAAGKLAASLGCPNATTDPAELLADPAVQAVVIAAPARFHAGLVVAAARAGKAVFCEKPMAVTLADADRAIAAARMAGVPLQVGFNRRFDRSFRAAHDLVAAGGVGTPAAAAVAHPRPGIPDPSRVPPSTIFLETLIHDFDALRDLNPGSEAVDVYAVADALAYPDFKAQGLQDTAVVVVRLDNGAIVTAEANFNAVYGYDIRLFHDAYTAELVHLVECARAGAPPDSTGEDARAALAIALAAIRSVRTGGPVRLDEVAEPATASTPEIARPSRSQAFRGTGEGLPVRLFADDRILPRAWADR
jgi:myo-inositol 2-dehydrogenase / D-chiro-inositol 1-dehydrogenase